MKKTLQLSFLLLLVSITALAQSDKYWKRTNTQESSTARALKNRTFPESSLYYNLNLETFRQAVSSINDAGKTSNVIVSIPNIDGEMEQFKIWEYSNFAPELQAQFPNIRAYAGVGINDKSSSIRISIAPNGIQTMVLRGDRKTEFMEPYTVDGKGYALFNSSEKALPFACTTKEDAELTEQLLDINKSTFSNTRTLKTFRLALSCTSEYTTFHGGTVAGALAAMNATMTRVNGVYEIDLAVKLELIPQEANIIFTNASTDPYSIPSIGNAQTNPTWNLELQNTLTSIIGNDGYDIGHLFGDSGGGGNAGCIGCICINPTTDVPKGKGSGYTSPGDGIPEGDTFDIDYVAHELGHQLGGNHTFSHNYEGSGVNVEPGGGSTIMAYAGITNYNVQMNSDDYFTYRSILQIQNNLANKDCGVNTPMANTPPTVDAGLNYAIPISTPFILTGVGSDAETNAAVTYTWEQNNSGSSATTQANSVASPTKTVGPNFRSVKPSATPIRYMPALSTVLANSLSTTYESVSSVARSLSFTLTARDYGVGGGQTNTDQMTVSVNAAAGPFNVTSQNVDGTSYQRGSSQLVTWTVNNTTSLTGSANVDILLSTDGGLTYPTVLVAGTPNDGSESITIPNNVTGEFCRIMVKPTGNIYYDINSKAFSIGYDCNVVSNATSVAIPDGTGTTTPGAESIINLTSTGTVNDIKITVNATHSRIGNLRLTLIHPDGTSVILMNRACNSAVYSNMAVTFQNGAPTVVCSSPLTGTYRASGTLANLNGKPLAGNWTLRVQDFATGDTGTLDSWSLNLGCTLGNEEVAGLADFKIYPNPNKGSFTVQFDSKSGNEIKVGVNDISGRQIFNRSYQNTGLFSENLKLDNLQSGIYLVTVQDGDRREVKKIVVE